MQIELTVMTAAKKTISRKEKRQTSASYERQPDPALAMSKVPDVRADVVARGRALILDPNYPSKEQMRKVAELLINKLTK